MEELPVQAKPKHIACEEDEDFTAMFDKMLNENIAETRGTGLPRAQQVDIVAPLHTRTKKTYGSATCCSRPLVVVNRSSPPDLM